MQRTIFLIATFCWIFQSACVTSVHPLATYDRAVTDAKLPGIWKSESQEFLIQPCLESDYFKSGQNSSMSGDKIPFTTKEKEDSLLLTKSYIVEYSKGNGHYVMLANFVRLNDHLFMSCLPIDGSYTTHEGGGVAIDIPASMRGYTIAKVQWQNSNTLKLNFIDGSFLYDQIKSGRMKLKHESDDMYDTFLITASTNDLQHFLEKYGSDDRFFDKENSVTLTRKS